MYSFFLRLCLFLPLCFSASFAQAERAVIDRIVVVVNEEIITESDIQELRQTLATGGLIDEMLLFDSNPEELANDRLEILNFLINEKILDSEVKRLNLNVTMDRVEQEIRDIARRNNASRDQLLEALRSQGVSTSQYQNFIRKRIERQSLIEAEVSSRIRISDEDIMAEHQRRTGGGSQSIYEYEVSHILLSPTRGGTDSARARAEQVLQRLDQGESFEVLAEQFSEDPGFESGGALGTFRAGELSEELDQALRRLQPGQYSRIVRSRAGFHILKNREQRIVSNPAFERQREQLRAYLFEQAFQRQFQDWLADRRESFIIRINE